jgi:hypothetical protein
MSAGPKWSGGAKGETNVRAKLAEGIFYAALVAGHVEQEAREWARLFGWVRFVGSVALDVARRGDK